MTLILRKDKGSPLTTEEMDNNFLYLERRATANENGHGYIESIDRIEQEDETLTIMGTLGTILGVVTIPKSLPPIRGAWAPNTPYHNGDWVRHHEHIYVCLQDHTADNFNPTNFLELL